MGYARAQSNVGVFYQNGRLKKDDSKAVDWYLKAAEQGNAVAQYNLAVCYERGEGTEPDEAMAAQWYRKAADQGHAGAMSFFTN
jgi:hypothetical protein